MTRADGTIPLARQRVLALLEQLERMAAGDRGASLEISPAHDELDAIAFGINVLGDELRWTHARMSESERLKADELRRAKEDAERANASKSVFLRNASHEIRTPVAAVLSLVELLASPDLSIADRTDLIGHLGKSARALQELVDDLLDLSRLEAGRLSLSVEPVSPVALIHEVVQSLEPQARRKGLALGTQVDALSSVLVETDPLRLRQILVNVIGNAVKFTDNGRVEVTAAVHESKGGDDLYIDVIDTGPGIGPEHRSWLFEPFGQPERRSALKHSGTGLGLAISQRLAEQLGGALMLLDSVEGEGSTFRLTLGARPVRTPVPATTPRSAAFSTADRSLRRIRILLVEDDPGLRVALPRLLRSIGATVDCAGDGDEAVQQALSSSYDIILMDVMLPNADGFEATRALRREGCQLPILALTADASADCRVASVEAGCDGILTKPFDADDLLTYIHRLMRVEL